MDTGGELPMVRLAGHPTASLHAIRTRTRSDQPAVRLQSGADQASALAAAATPGSQRAAMEELHRGGLRGHVSGTPDCTSSIARGFGYTRAP